MSANVSLPIKNLDEGEILDSESITDSEKVFIIILFYINFFFLNKTAYSRSNELTFLILF